LKYLEKYGKEAEVFVCACHRLAQNMYVTGHGGNLAWKLEPGTIMISPTQMNKGRIQPEDLVFITPDGEIIEGKRKPSGETPLHLNFFRERPDIRSIIHSHPPMASVFAITKGRNLLMRPILPETVFEVGPVPVVPYAEPVSQKLADNFLPFLKKYNSFLMESHGLVLISPYGIEQTLMLTELVEATSTSLLEAAQMGEIKEIGRDEVQKLDKIMKARGVSMIGAPGENASLVDLYF